MRTWEIQDANTETTKHAMNMIGKASDIVILIVMNQPLSDTIVSEV